MSHHRAGAAASNAVDEYWTRRRQRRAEPRDLLTARGIPRGRPHLAASGSGGKPGVVPPVPSAGGTGGAGSSEPSASGAPAGAAFQVPDFDAPPNTVHGKVFAKDRSGPFQCSATAVTAQNHSVVVTAGHCVRLDPFGWARKFIFIPSYREGAEPFGAWTWSSFWIPSKWKKRQSSNYDLAAVVLEPRNGVTVQDVVGAAGFAWNQPRKQSFQSFGYPMNFFSAQRMMSCVSPSRRGPDFGRGPRMEGMTCDMGKGSSGGAWLIESQLVNSVQSLGRRNFSAGPYFGKSARRVYNRAQRQ